MVVGSKIFKVTYDILRGVNETVWGGAASASKVGTIIKTGGSGADVVIGTSHALEDFACNDPICGTIDVVGSVSTAVGMVLGNLPQTKHLTVVTGSITVGCRTVRYYCKQYGTFWGCSASALVGVKEVIKFTVKK